MNWIALIFINIIAISIVRIIQKKILQAKNADSIALSIVFQLLTGIFIGIFAISQKSSLLDYSDLVPNIILMVLLYTFAGIFLFKAFKLAEGSTISLILSTTSVWTILSSVIFLGESLNKTELAGISLIIFSIILVNLEGISKLKIGKGQLFALISGALFGIALTNDFYIIGDNSPYSYASMSFILPSIFTALIFPKSVKKISYFLSSKMIFTLFVLCILYAISLLTLLLAYQNGGKSSVLAPVSQSSVILIVLLAAIFLNEKSHLKLKLFSATISIVGILLTTAA